MFKIFKRRKRHTNMFLNMKGTVVVQDTGANIKNRFLTLTQAILKSMTEVSSQLWGERRETMFYMVTSVH